MKVLSLNNHTHKGIPVHSILLFVSTIFPYILLDDHFNVIQRDMKNWDLSFDFKSPTISSIVSFQRMLKANANTTPISGLCSLFVLKSPHDFYHHFLLWCTVSLQLLVISLRYNASVHWEATLTRPLVFPNQTRGQFKCEKNMSECVTLTVVREVDLD